jgi:hypothetical protein
MKLLSCLLLSSVAVFCAAPKPDVEKAVLAAEKVWVAAALKGDKATLTKMLGDDLTYTHSSSKTENKTEVVGNTALSKSIDFKDTTVRQYGNTAIVTHNAKIVNQQGVVSNLFVTHVWVNQNGGWQLVSRQATKLPQ